MRTGNTTEQAAPWKFEWRFDRFIPPKWKRPYLIGLHILLKFIPWFTCIYGAPGLSYIEAGEGYLVDNIRAEVNAAIVTLLVLLDFFITKAVLGPRLTGLHHGFKKDEDGKITYHFYAEKDFLARYPATDRDSFFTFFVIFSFIWFCSTAQTLLAWNKFWILFTILGFISVYLNLYLFVQTRYYKQWDMPKFFATWAYNFFIRYKYMDNDDTENENRFRNTYYDNRVRY